MKKEILKVKEVGYGRLFRIKNEDETFFVEPETFQQNRIKVGDIITAFISGKDIIAYSKEGGER